MADEIKIRAATPDDAPALLKIYAPYVKNTSITYEYDVPSEEEFRSCLLLRELQSVSGARQSVVSLKMLPFLICILYRTY